MSALDPSGLSLSAQEIEELWIASGLRKQWRVVSELRTFGEFDDVADAYKLRDLLVDGNPNLRRLA